MRKEDVLSGNVKIAKAKKPKCWNCKFASEPFKIVGNTHVHCLNQEKYPKDEIENGNISPWETLREGYCTCDKHEFNVSNITPDKQ